MEKQPLLSIIVPVYNVASYLPDCLDSLLVQTYPNFELLLVDDGSTDESWAVLQAYAAKDSRVRIFQKENGGVSSARNFGLDRAQGEYIGFVDADDFVAPQYLEWLYRAADSCGAPMSMCAYRCVEEGREAALEKHCTEYPQPRLVTEETYSWMCSASGGHCWRMLTHRDILKDVRFDTTLWYGEDALFFMQEFLKAGKLAFVESPLYGYRIRQGSAVQQNGSSKRYTAYQAWTKVWELVKDKPDPMRVTTEERYIMSCAEVYNRMSDQPGTDAAQMQQLLRTAREHRRAAWKIPSDQMRSKVQAIAVGYCPRLGLRLWQLTQWYKVRRGK